MRLKSASSSISSPAAFLPCPIIKSAAGKRRERTKKKWGKRRKRGFSRTEQTELSDDGGEIPFSASKWREREKEEKALPGLDASSKRREGTHGRVCQL